MKVDLLSIGVFPPNVKALNEEEFRCHSMEEVEADETLRASIRGIITRSNYEVPAEIIRRLPNLKIIATNGVGFDLIPLDVARECGVVVTNTPDVLNAAVAELCVGQLLAMLRRIPQGDQYVRSGAWRSNPFPLATSLAGKCIGFVGLGRIGKEIAHRLVPFGVSIAYTGRTDQRLGWTYEPDLHALARMADVLILSMPGGRETARMINASVFEALGPDGYLINIARGSVVDEDALIAALSERRIAGAALDVFNKEPDIDPRFFTLDNIVLTPHAGSATSETRMAMARLTLDNLHSYFETGRALTPVDM